MCSVLEEKYATPVVPLDVLNLNIDNINMILEKVLSEFPITKINFSMPDWMRTLPYESPLISGIVAEIGNQTSGISKISEACKLKNLFAESENLSAVVSKVNLGDGSIDVDISANQELFYKILSETLITIIIKIYFKIKIITLQQCQLQQVCYSCKDNQTPC